MPFAFSDERGKPGDTVAVQCIVSSGDQPINFTWSLNGQPLSATSVHKSDVIVSKIGSRTSSLTIEYISQKHAGNYTCTGTNVAGNASYTAELYVDGLFPAEMDIENLIFSLEF